MGAEKIKRAALGLAGWADGGEKRRCGCCVGPPPAALGRALGRRPQCVRLQQEPLTIQVQEPIEVDLQRRASLA